MKEILGGILAREWLDKCIEIVKKDTDELWVMRAFDTKEMLYEATEGPNPSVKETVLFVLKRLERLEESRKAYKPLIYSKGIRILSPSVILAYQSS